MKRKIEYSPNILLFEFIVCFVENDLNFMKTASALKKERTNLYRLFNNFCKQENIVFYTVHNGKKEITRQGACAYYHSRLIITAYKQIKSTSDWYQMSRARRLKEVDEYKEQKIKNVASAIYNLKMSVSCDFCSKEKCELEKDGMLSEKSCIDCIGEYFNNQIENKKKLKEVGKVK